MERRKTFAIDVEPKVLEWAITSSGWTQDEITKKLKINKNALGSWLKGETKPTLKQIENLSSIVKRPLAAFLLTEPPIEKPIPKDYRMLPGKEGKFEKKTLLAFRRARRLQKISKELSENVFLNIKSDIFHAKIYDDPKKIAEMCRNEFKISEDFQKKFKTSYEEFNFLRDIIEERNIYVFQIPMPIDDARGFTLVDDTPSTIIVNSKDSIEARIFTLIHELGHVILEESGVSMPEDALFIKNANIMEKWCNDFASEFLFTESLAKEIFIQNKDILIETKTLNTLSRKYKVSKAMLLYKMSKLNFISKTQYDSVLERYKSRPVKMAVRGGFSAVSADKKCLNEKGQRFVSLVTANVERGFITHSDALNYLSIKSKNLEKVTSRVKK